ncbi:MAG: DUF1499 domain-containing protein [Devosia sp.]
MRILVRTSRWAIWARRLGNFALPLAVIPILMHRAEAINTLTFEVAEALAIVVAFAAIIAAISGLVRIWVTGDHGWNRALTGLACGLVCLVPPAYWAVQYVRYPAVAEVSTAPGDPPPLISAAPPPLDAADLARVEAAFPNAKSRNYPNSAAQAFSLVNALVIDRGWQVEQRREPRDDGTDGQLNAIALTMFGFHVEVAIRVRATADGSATVDMRSVALTGLHEPGANGRRVEEFLAALDTKVSTMMQDEPAGTADDGDADTTQSPASRPVTPMPHNRKR